MLEMLLCSLLTILPDYLYRRYVQGKRFGKEITLYSVWFELRWGITSCLMLTVGLITVVFYNHPSTTNVTLFFRTVPDSSGNERTRRRDLCRHQRPGRQGRADLQARQLEAGSRRGDRAPQDRGGRCRDGGGASSISQKAEGQIRGGQERSPAGRGRTGDQAGAARRNPGIVAFREIEKLEVRVERPQGGGRCRHRGQAGRRNAALDRAPGRKGQRRSRAGAGQVELEKTVVRAGVTGRVEQFFLRVGDIVNPLMRPAGILIPEGAGQRGLQAGFGQIEAQVMKVGMSAEVTCVSKPFTIIPMVVTDVQDYIAAGQFRGGEQLIDPQQVTRPGTSLVFLEPLYEGGLDGVTPGSSCIANAYSSNHDVIAAKETGTMQRVAASRGGCSRARARPDPAASGAGASVQDAGVQRTLTRQRGAAFSRSALTAIRSD